MATLTLKSIDDFQTNLSGAVTILADETPSSLTIDGGDVEGLPDNYVLAAGSMIIAPDADYIAFEGPDENGDTEFTQKYNAAPAAGEG